MTDQLDLDTLSETQQRELYDRLAFKFTAASAQPSEAESEVWDAVHQALNAVVRLSYAEFVKGYGKRKFIADVKAVRLILDRACGAKLLKIQRLALLKLAFESLADVLDERHIPSTPKNLLQNVQLLPYALDASFPGYASAKLLHRVVPLVSGS